MGSERLAFPRFEELRPLGSRTEAFGGLERFVYPALKNALEDGRPF